MTPSKNNCLRQTSEQSNPMEGHVPLNDELVLSHEQTALYKDIAEVFSQNSSYI